jgi:hypothetical protein
VFTIYARNGPLSSFFQNFLAGKIFIFCLTRHSQHEGTKKKGKRAEDFPKGVP